MVKTKPAFSFIPILVALGLLFGVYFWYTSALTPPSTSPVSTVFVIQKGESLSSIAARLKSQGFVRDALAFRLFVLKNRLATKIQAGSYHLLPGQSVTALTAQLTKGTLDIWVTIPEGWRHEEITRRLVQVLPDFDHTQFLALAHDQEGYLFPDTYLLPLQVDPATVLQLFLTNFKRKYTADFSARAASLNLTEIDVLTLASIVEREAQQDSDRAIIAGIILKRLHNAWPLQTDATIQYAKANQNRALLLANQDAHWWPMVTGSDLRQIHSPYNTYLNTGLPPTPICNPGLAAIKAVLYPQESDYWFYLTDSLGQMHYAVTDAEHQANIAQYLN